MSINIEENFRRLFDRDNNTAYEALKVLQKGFGFIALLLAALSQQAGYFDQVYFEVEDLDQVHAEVVLVSQSRRYFT